MPSGQGKPRDPVSQMWDRAAAAIVRRVYAQKGGWYATRIKNPGPQHVTYFLRMWDIDVTGPDNAGTISGKRNNYRTRWNRAFVRAVYNYNRKDGERRPLEIQVGSPKPAGPGNLPAGWAVRLRVRPGGRKAQGAVDRKRDVDRIWTGDGQRGGRFSDQNWDWL